MARRKAKFDLTLFPFLSVLSGLIAVLMLFMIVTISTRVIEASEEGFAPPPPILKPLGNETGVDDGIDSSSYLELSQKLDKLSVLVARKMQERDELQRKRQELLELIESKKDEMVALPTAAGRQTGVKLGAPSPVQVVPVDTPGGSSKDPIRVEVKADGYVVHRSKQDPTFFPAITELKAGGKEKNKVNPKLKAGEKEKYKVDPMLKKFLDQVDENRKKEYLVFLIHPSGIQSFWNIRSYVAEKYHDKVKGRDGEEIVERIDTGWEPFAREWILSKD